MTEIRVGIIGWGNVTRTLHAPCLSEMDGFDLVAACDPDPAQRADAQDRYACQAYQDVHALLQHPGLELVVVATPNHLHGQLSIAALEAGKHTIVEKPMCIRLQEADAMLERARQHQCVFSVHQNRRWDRDFLAVKALLDEGTLGQVVMIQSRVAFGPYTKASGWGARKQFTGGGAFLSFGPHLIDRILSIAPPGPVTVHGIVRSIMNEDDYFHCTLEFAGGWTAQIEVSRGSRMRSAHSFVVMCERGEIRTWTEENGERPLWLRRDDGTDLRKTVPADPPLYLHSQPFYRDIYQAIHTGSPVIVDPELSRKYVAIAEAIAHSSETHTCIVVP
jgi:predicted dehydrogenase